MITNIFKLLDVYAGWTETIKRGITEEELSLIEKCIVIPGKYAPALEVSFKEGGKSFIQLSRDCPLTIGEVVDPNTLVFITLSKVGSDDIYRVDIKR